jgi:hypothetical protein
MDGAQVQFLMCMVRILTIRGQIATAVTGPLTPFVIAELPRKRHACQYAAAKVMVKFGFVSPPTMHATDF